MFSNLGHFISEDKNHFTKGTKPYEILSLFSAYLMNVLDLTVRITTKLLIEAWLAFSICPACLSLDYSLE